MNEFTHVTIKHPDPNFPHLTTPSQIPDEHDKLGIIELSNDHFSVDLLFINDKLHNVALWDDSAECLIASFPNEIRESEPRHDPQLELFPDPSRIPV